MRSLRWRLLIGASTAILAAVVVAWLFMTVLFERHLDSRVRTQLAREADRLVAELVVDAQGRLSLPEALPADPRLNKPAGGYYWQVQQGEQLLRSRSLWDQTLEGPPTPPSDAWRLSRSKGPFEASVYLLDRTVKLTAQGRPIVIRLAETSAETASAQAEFGLELAVFLGLLWLFLSLAAWLQVHLGLAPLRRIGRDLDALRQSPDARLGGGQASEVQPLIAAINSLATAREADLRHARGRAADLAHGLKTPVAALAAQSRLVREEGLAEAADGLDRAIEAIRATVETELARSRLAVVGGRGAAHPREVVEQIIGVLEQTVWGETLVFTNTIPDDLTAPLDAEDLTELIGALMENAARFGRRRVVIDGRQDAEATILTIDDDGPGLEGPERVQPDDRRLDRIGGPGGRGLAIARAFAEASNGALTLRTSPLGGVSAELSWRKEERAPPGEATPSGFPWLKK